MFGDDIKICLQKGEVYMTNVIIFDIIQKDGYNLQKLVDAFENHSDYEWEQGNDHGSYSMVSGEKYWVKDGEYWVVDVPAQAAQPEQGHWEYK